MPKLPSRVGGEKPATRAVSWPWRRRFAARRRPGLHPRLIPRGSPGEALALQAIVLMKTVKSATFFALGLAAFALVGADVGALAQRLAEALHFDVHRAFIEDVVGRLASLTPRQKATGGAGAVVYACVLAAEAVGLHRRRRWAAWLAVGVGSLLLPVEVYEFIRFPRVRLGLAFAVNLAIVVYLTIEARRARPGRRRRG